MGELKKSLLDAQHRAAGARMVPFGGWDMPVSYPTGTLAEHLACRNQAALFDVSHLGSLELIGPKAFDQLQHALSNDLRRIAPGKAQYTHLLDSRDASVVDDIIVWWIEPERFWVLPNAANAAGVTAALSQSVDRRPERALLAVQGPEAKQRLATVSAEAAQVGRFRVKEIAWQGHQLLVAGTGYTGEQGVEIAVPQAAAESLWAALVEAGCDPAGLGARDTLRLEAGLPLHGHELGPGITPLDAGLGWVVGWDKEAFIGREALLAAQESGLEKRLRGLTVEGRRPPREGQTVLKDGEAIATLTSGNFSPILGHGIALAFLPPHLLPGETVAIDQRGTEVPAQIVKLPFVG